MLEARCKRRLARASERGQAVARAGTEWHVSGLWRVCRGGHWQVLAGADGLRRVAMDGVGQAFDGVWACGLLGGRGRGESAGSGWPSLTFVGDDWCWWAISVDRAVRRSGAWASGPPERQWPTRSQLPCRIAPSDGHTNAQIEFQCSFSP